MRDLYGTDSMPETAENVAHECAIERAAQDAFAWRSQQRAARAVQDGYFAEEIVPVEIVGIKGNTLLDCDEHPRPDTTPEKLVALKPLFPGGTVTAGNASGLNDGAAALIIASENAVSRYHLKPHAHILGMATAGVSPRVMGIGPVPATQKLLARLNQRITEFDWIQLNEAFASQSLACLRQLGLPDDADHVNATGGAIALGHPLGMSGARLVMTAAHQLQRFGGTLALATMCIGVGQGIAMAIERV
jgi:3-oxoadipyl-CoA thiolase